MKTALKQIDAVTLLCPECGEVIPHTDGPLYWVVNELPAPGTPMDCPACGKQSKSPKV